ncbi:alpha-ketoglutarate-dependent dioxygenase alkB homolog 4-like [Pollicipes pollicipes]|uniref:alpha-ketoglutarate-dependent dioxygenase alkB homolog 4-like n=1 Tax=Pollicipes pollicipes TaxID=41117 RepID=UPI0018851BFE|nr:alpha-ketoglutarate-dependent dioxygenase alkB homolog 4-like [Pollicipes pollicipes]
MALNIPGCGCKAQNTCLQCEPFSAAAYKPFVTPSDGPSYVFCPLCRLAWPGWAGDSWRAHPHHAGRSLRFPGVHIVPDLLTADEEQQLMADIDALPWDASQSGRRKQNFGPKTNFNRRKLKMGAFRGFPEFGRWVQARLAREPVLRGYQTIEQCSLEYRPQEGACIAPHIDDCWVWGERVVTVSLLKDSVLTMVKYQGGEDRYNLRDRPPPRAAGLERPPTVRLPMPRRSLLVLEGAARYEWLHGILREDVTERRVCLALREFTPAFLPGGQHEALGAEVIAQAQNFWTVPPAAADAAA